MTVTIDITENDVFTALVTFLQSFLPENTEIVQGLDNQVPMPIGPFVQITSMGMLRIATNQETYSSSLQEKMSQTQARYEVQVDFLGPNAQAWAMQMQSLFRDEYAVDMFPTNIVPLYADDPIQIPLIDAEAQYERRWKVTAELQYNPVITTPQQSAATIQIGIAPVDQTFKP